MSIIGIIPARYGSSRLPGKPLIKVRGKSIIQRVYERAKQSTLLNEVIVATDDIRIANHVTRFGGRSMITRIDHTSGTTRCAEVLEHIPAKYVVNIQGDEPLIDPAEIDRLAAHISAGRQISTLVKKIESYDEIEDAREAKVILGARGKALYFSRSPIPFVREIDRTLWHETGIFYKHIGMYAYSANVLTEIARLERSKLEEVESLEQLNWLYHGYEIDTLETTLETIGIDEPGDLDLLERLLDLAENS